MEDALVHAEKDKYVKVWRVLILVLMEDALVLFHPSSNRFQFSLS
mgnify:CR=1 FL=1